jgi:hypothetical protein
VESELELSATTDFAPDQIRAKAHIIREKAIQNLNEQGKKPKDLIDILLKKHQKIVKDSLSRRAIIIYLSITLKLAKRAKS